MSKYSFLIFLYVTFLVQSVKAQSTLDTTQLTKEFFNLEEAPKKPETVFKLNLSNQSLQIPDSIWLKFPNLQFLSLKNDHLKQLPAGIGNLRKLKVLDLSGNDFKVLPMTFSSLTNLEELYLNNDKYFQLDKSIPVLSKLPKLKSLYLENNGLQRVPNTILKLTHLESLYLSNNDFKYFPGAINGMRNLKYLDFHDNKLRPSLQDGQNLNSGLKIRF